MVPALNAKNMVLAPWCEEITCEDNVKKFTKAESMEESKAEPAAGAGEEAGEEEGGESRGLTGAAKSLCIPMEQVCFRSRSL